MRGSVAPLCSGLVRPRFFLLPHDPVHPSAHYAARTSPCPTPTRTAGDRPEPSGRPDGTWIPFLRAAQGAFAFPSRDPRRSSGGAEREVRIAAAPRGLDRFRTRGTGTGTGSVLRAGWSRRAMCGAWGCCVGGGRRSRKGANAFCRVVSAILPSCGHGHSSRLELGTTNEPKAPGLFGGRCAARAAPRLHCCVSGRHELLAGVNQTGAGKLSSLLSRSRHGIDRAAPERKLLFFIFI
jgi:hypothetical protein